MIWKQGSTARLQCTVKGSPELHSTWFLNNSELSTGGRHAVGLKDSVATLEIHDVLLTDSGNYTCEVLNECGCESCSIKVTVKGVSSFWQQKAQVCAKTHITELYVPFRTSVIQKGVTVHRGSQRVGSCAGV